MSDEAASDPPVQPPAIDARDSAGLIVGNSGTVNQHFGDVINRGQPLSREEIQNRKNLSVMRQAVRKFWVEGVLNQSLYREALIRLNLAERADAVNNRPWNLLVQTAGQASAMLPPNTRIVDVFDQMQQRLLILGEPGSGKTTTLLELARELLERADRDPALPTPVVFNLSSWAERRPPLAEWLADELRARYSIPKDIARDWVKRDALLLLLDGLDEVQAQHREACAQAINDFRQAHMVPLAVCSRTAEYERLSQQLKLDGAVLLQPLTAEQTEAYLDRAGGSLSALRGAMGQDAELREMAESPLLLSIMAMAYQDAAPAEVSAVEGGQARRQHLFDSYIARMFVRREMKLNYAPIRTLGWLRWLAQRLVQYGQTTFLIERMQPGWVQPATSSPLGAYFWMALWGPILGIGFGFICGLTLGLGSGLLIGVSRYTLEYAFTRALIFGLLIGLSGVLIDVLSGGFRELRFVAGSGKSTQRLMRGFPLGVLCGSSGALFSGLVSGLSNRTFGVNESVTYGLFLGIVGWLIGIRTQVRLTSPAIWSLNRMRANKKFGQRIGLIYGFSVTLIAIGVTIWIVELRASMTVGLALGIFGYLVVSKAVAYAFDEASQDDALDILINRLPNQTIRDSTRFVWQLTLLSGLIFTLLFGLTNGLMGVLIFGMIGGPIGGLLGGGDVVAKHWLIRMALWLKGNIPFNYVRFLDHAAALIFLRKVGGGYIFVHRLVMEHFAGLSEDDMQRIVSAIPRTK